MVTDVGGVDTADASAELCQNERECRLERRLESLVNSMESLQMLVLQCSLLYLCFALPDADAAGLAALVIVCLAKKLSFPPFLLYGGPALIAIVMLTIVQNGITTQEDAFSPALFVVLVTAGVAASVVHCIVA
jgi:hypothetical protein